MMGKKVTHLKADIPVTRNEIEMDTEKIPKEISKPLPLCASKCLSLFMYMYMILIKCTYRGFGSAVLLYKPVFCFKYLFSIDRIILINEIKIVSQNS